MVLNFRVKFSASLVLKTVMEDLSEFQICFLGGLILFFFFTCEKEETKAAFYSDSQVDFCIALETVPLHRAGLFGSPFIQFSARFTTITY